jgi:hypothetical protein
MYDFAIPFLFSGLHSSEFKPLSCIHVLPKPFGEYQKAPMVILAIAERIIAHRLRVNIKIFVTCIQCSLALFFEKRKSPEQMRGWK